MAEALLSVRRMSGDEPAPGEATGPTGQPRSRLDARVFAPRVANDPSDGGGEAKALFGDRLLARLSAVGPTSPAA